MFWYNSVICLQALNPDQTLGTTSVTPHGLAGDRTPHSARWSPPGEGRLRRSCRRVRWVGACSTHVPSVRGSLGPQGADHLGRVHEQQPEDQRMPARCQSFSPTATAWTSQLFVLADFYNIYRRGARNGHRSTPRTRSSTPRTRLPGAGFEHLQESSRSRVASTRTLRRPLSMTALKADRRGWRRALPHAQNIFAVSTIVNLLSRGEMDNVGFFALPGTGANRPRPRGCRLRSMLPAKHEGTRQRWGRDSLTLSRAQTGCDADDRRHYSQRSIPGRRVARSRTTSQGRWLGHVHRSSDGGTSARTRVPLPDQGALTRADHRRGRLRNPGVAQDGAALYDEDVKKQAQQLGLDGW